MKQRAQLVVRPNHAHYIKRQIARAHGRGSPRIPAALLAGFFLIRVAGAQDAAKTKEAMSNMQAELSVCIAYFSIFKECSAKEGKNPRFGELAIENLGIKSEAAADAIGMSSADVAMRLELNLTSQRHLIGSCSGMTILLSRYSEQCNDLVLGVDRNSKKYLTK
jgi:hypothetical protein